MQLHRHLKSTACAAIFAASAFSAAVAAAPAAVMRPQQTQYVRMHQTASAFVDSIDNIAERYRQSGT